MNRDVTIPTTHPRYFSLMTREKIVAGYKNGLVALEGLIAHGRGECFDYLIGERTTDSARMAIDAAAAQILISNYPVISVNGNVAALCPDLLCSLHRSVKKSMLEINLFYYTKERESKIFQELAKYGVSNVLGTNPDNLVRIPELESNRRLVDSNGIFKADTVFVPLEDGDRTLALKKMGKKVITVDLNPLSRTSMEASITIVDNIIRVIPLLIERIKYHEKNSSESDLYTIVKSYDNKKGLKDALFIMNRYKEDQI
ncbi:4-phosphopantoate--beta-alanine ligase [Candidatus Nitrosocosmicus franklandus]|uniref:4-phosphopantoate--beta-alanine ligase n=1 Tax=Candidatus Nitrosocosmicus franklandianus TaxID=1798806 RepID=A0A484IJD1_9ARCH|nr:4-phosphopantoate--beta-alanine ligase [Candidatus Nitrosocosmicus franklandus]